MCEESVKVWWKSAAMLCENIGLGSFWSGLLTIFCNFENLSGNLPLSEFVVFLFANTTEFAQADENEIII